MQIKADPLQKKQRITYRLSVSRLYSETFLPNQYENKMKNPVKDNPPYKNIKIFHPKFSENCPATTGPSSAPIPVTTNTYDNLMII